MPQKSLQPNLKESIFDNNQENLPPEVLAMQKAKKKMAQSKATNDNKQINNTNNVVYGKFTNQKNREKEEVESQEFFQNNAGANLPKNLQNVYDPQKRFEDKNKAEITANENIELAKYYAKQNKNKYSTNDNQKIDINDTINRANSIRSAANANKSSEEKRQIALRVSTIQKVFREEKINLTENEAVNLLDSGFKVPFPAFMFMFAICKDISDILINVISAGLIAGGNIVTASVVGAPIGMPISGLGLTIGMINSLILTPLYLIIFNIWLRKYGQEKNNFKAATKLTPKIVKKLMPTLVGKMIIELIPFINALPINTLNVISVYRFYAKLSRKGRAATA